MPMLKNAPMKRKQAIFRGWFSGVKQGNIGDVMFVLISLSAQTVQTCISKITSA
jgi:hypothetical protein